VFGFGITSVTTDELAARLDTGRVVLVDVREPDEFASGHVPGARNVPLAQLPSAAASLDPTAETLLICRSGHRSVTATKQLKKLGFTHAINVKGGTLAWRGPLER